MKVHTLPFVLAGSYLGSVAAAPAPAPAITPAPALDEALDKRGILSSVLSGVESAVGSLLGVASSEASILNSLLTQVATNAAQKAALTSAYKQLASLTPTATPTATEDIPSILSSIIGTATPTSFVDYTIQFILNGLVEPQQYLALIEGESPTDNSATNTNNPAPSHSIYPKKLACDAPYSQTEAALREQIYLPPGFTFGKKPPVILFPGTGGRGGIDFAGNFLVTLADVSYADPVLINPTGFLVTDVQKNSELAAYAINYISAISGNVNVSVIGWSQANTNVQWALKYWPSTRSILSDLIGISPLYHGSVINNLMDPGNLILMPPAQVQQEYNAAFISTLRSNGGDSAYVPTTNIYSGNFDELVEPQSGSNASGILNDARNVGVTNAQVQVVCGADSPAGFFQTHESMLANSLSYALAVDALTHEGPGEISRIDLATVCQDIFAPGLSLADIVATEFALLVTLTMVGLYPDKVLAEPAISPYATMSPSACATTTSAKPKHTITIPF